ncbi:MAG: hypothetical protein ABII01_03960 [Candidatus Woesearchaeota archaeon]
MHMNRIRRLLYSAAIVGLGTLVSCATFRSPYRNHAQYLPEGADIKQCISETVDYNKDGIDDIVIIHYAFQLEQGVRRMRIMYALGTDDKPRFPFVVETTTATLIKKDGDEYLREEKRTLFDYEKDQDLRIIPLDGIPADLPQDPKDFRPDGKPDCMTTDLTYTIQINMELRIPIPEQNPNEPIPAEKPQKRTLEGQVTA